MAFYSDCIWAYYHLAVLPHCIMWHKVWSVIWSMLLVSVNRLTPTVPDWVALSFFIFDIRALWRSAGCFMAVPIWQQWASHLWCAYDLCWQVFINAAVSQSIVHSSDGRRQSYYVAREHSAVLCDTQVVMKLLLSWRLWESATDTVWLLAVSALNSLVRPDHPHQQYNVNQLCDAGLAAKMLDIWKVCSALCSLDVVSLIL